MHNLHVLCCCSFLSKNRITITCVYNSNFHNYGLVVPDGENFPPLPQRTFTPVEVERLRIIVGQDPTIVLDELQYAMYVQTGKYASIATLCRTLQTVGLSNQIIQDVHRNPSSTRLQCRFAMVASTIDFREFVWMGEVSSQVGHRKHRRDWGPANCRDRVKLPEIDGKGYSLASCMSYRSNGAALLVQGSLDRQSYLDYMKTSVLPSMNPYYDEEGRLTGLLLSVLVVYNCAIHK